MTPAKINFTIYQGSTFSQTLRWESSKKVYKEITGITNAAPCIITSVAHGLTEGWRFKITNVVGMTELNSSETYRSATIVDVDTIEINDVNSIGYKTYTSGGIIEYLEPVDLTGYTASMQIRPKVGDTTIIHDLTSDIIVDAAANTISLVISAADTATFDFFKGVYDLELTNAGVTTKLASGTITLVKEVTIL